MDTFHQDDYVLTEEENEPAESISSATQEVLEKGQQTWKALRKRGKVALDQTRREGEAAWASAQKLAEDFPKRAVITALFAGAILGLLIAHRDSE